MHCSTVKIKDDKKSHLIINESDFDPKKHSLYKEPKSKVAVKND